MKMVSCRSWASCKAGRVSNCRENDSYSSAYRNESTAGLVADPGTVRADGSGGSAGDRDKGNESEQRLEGHCDVCETELGDQGGENSMSWSITVDGRRFYSKKSPKNRSHRSMNNLNDVD